ncbi:MAG TPA: hypothetical protein DCQ58_06885 [Saprospirales bacterium]|nr:hypothetical protein [Saprospirales bacterium]
MQQLLYSLIFFLTYIFSLNAQTVSTQYGPVSGHLNENVFEFLGIPYASPPINNFRWKPPTATPAWTSPLMADNYAPVCPQKSFEQGKPDSVYTLAGDEDCLYLNIWSPDISANLPVMVFIHGGGNQQGSASQLTGGTYIFHGKNLAERGQVVVVTIQYRLGVLGFLVHPGLESESSNGKSGNYAVMDQLFALQWIRDNIAGFGGDASNVTVFGESAGGVNTGNLLTSPLAAGLFHKAIIQSAVPVITTYQDAKAQGIDFVNEFVMNGTDAEKISYMRSVHPDSFSVRMNSPLSGGIVQSAWKPAVDGNIFTSHPEAVFQSGNFNQVPLMIGSNSEEMSLSAPVTVLPYMVDALINLSVPLSLRAEAHALYPSGSTSEEARMSYVGILTDGQFTTTNRRTAQCVSLNQTEPVWRYFFTHKHTIPQLAMYGSYHGMELFYVFNNWENATLGQGLLFKPADDAVQQAMLRYWTNFARTGNPNGTGLENWPQYLSSDDCYLEIKAEPDGNQCGLRTSKSDFWDKVIGYTRCTSSVGLESQPDKKELTFFPNPTSGKIYLDLPQDLHDYEIFIYNSFGQKQQSFKNTDQIDLSGEACGIYFIEISSEGKRYTGRIVKTD